MSTLGGVAAVGAFALVTLAPALSAQAASPVVVGASPVSVGVNPNNHRVIVSNGPLNTVTIFDGSGVMPAAPQLNVGSFPSGLAVDPGLQLAFVTLPAEGKVAVIDLGATNPVVLRTIAVGTAPNSVAVDPVLHRVYVVNNGSANVSSFIGDDAMPTITTVAVGASPVGVGVDTATHAVFVASSSSSTIARFIGSDATPVATTIPAVRNAGSVAVDSRTHRVFVSNGPEDIVYRFSSEEANPTLKQIVVTGVPGAVLADPESGEVYVATPSINKLKYFDGTVAGAPSIAEMAVGTNPVALAIDPDLANRTVYVANRGNSTVSRIDGVLPAAPVITSATPPSAVVGSPYSFTFTASGQPAPSFGSSLGLGAQLSLDTAGHLTGTPTVAGPLTFTLTVSNSVAPAVTQTITIQVEAAPTTTPTPTPSPTSTSTPTGTTAPGTGPGGGSGGTGTGTAGGVGSGNGSGTNGNGSRTGGGLAHTGQALDTVAPIGMAGLILLAVGAAVTVERTSKKKHRRS